MLKDEANKIKYRGPDNTTFKLINSRILLGFHRLRINDLSNDGDQPLILKNRTNTLYLICNGEIYNHIQLANKYNIKTKSKSDCEIILHIYNILGFV